MILLLLFFSSGLSAHDKMLKKLIEADIRDDTEIIETVKEGQYKRYLESDKKTLERCLKALENKR